MDQNGISVIVPTYNEEEFLSESLSAIEIAKKFLQSTHNVNVEVVVVNNDSTDNTKDIAIKHGAIVVDHPIRNIASVRNAGIQHAVNNIIVTIDADSVLPKDALVKIWQTMQDDQCIGACLGVEFVTTKISHKVLAFFVQKIVFAISGIEGGMVCFRKSVAMSLGGFPEHRYVAEDVGFGRRMKKYAKLHGKVFGDRRDIRITTPDRKEIRFRDLCQVIFFEIKTLFGHQPAPENFNYWYSPKR